MWLLYLFICVQGLGRYIVSFNESQSILISTVNVFLCFDLIASIEENKRLSGLCDYANIEYRIIIISIERNIF